MSSDDSGFDKEAEREKLREKYGDDDDRENTRRMSELLLQGATMTGKHCDNCGDPIFRHDGQEFCPTCQHEARQQAQNETQSQSDESQSQSAEATGQAGTAERAAQIDTAQSDASADQPDDDEPRVEINDVRVADQHADRHADQHADRSSVRRPPSQTTDRRATDDRQQVQRDRQQSHRDTRNRRRDNQQGHRDHQYGDVRSHTHDGQRTDGKSGRGAESATELGPAREALVRKLTDLAHTAEETDDVARSRELLAATREAAEALDALDRANH